MAGFSSPSDYINSAFNNNSSSLTGIPIGFEEIWNDFNNISQLAQVMNRGWVGSDPLFSNLYIFQPALYNGLYLPRNLVKKVSLPERDLVTESFKFKGGKISYVTGFTVTDLTVTFYENQQLQVLSYLNTWRSDIASIAGGEYGLPNDYKYTMFFIYNNSLGNPTNTLSSNLVGLLPNGLSKAINTINFCGICILNGCFPTNVSYTASENLVSTAYEVTAKFSVDEFIQIPLGADLDTILAILGLGSSAANVAGATFNNLSGLV